MIHIVGNWKMNKQIDEIYDFINQIGLFVSKNTISCNISLSPPTLYLPLFSDVNSINLVAQNVSAYNCGPYTGEVSATMLAQYVKYVLVGHSERRIYFNEKSSILSQKLSMCFNSNLIPIFCVGENTAERLSQDYFTCIKNQLLPILKLLTTIDLSNIMIAYEPVWAIGTGETASSEQVLEMHSFIRSLCADVVGEEKSKLISILYGGSCNEDNAELLLSQNNVNGLLVGGASLDCRHFMSIISIANTVSK